MKRLFASLALTLFALSALVPGANAGKWTAGMKLGNPAFQSIGPLAFGPEGILFAADTKAAAIVALATEDTASSSEAKPVKIEGIDQKIAGLLGTSADQILIQSMAVNPLSHNVYLSVSRGRGPDAIPVLIRVKADGKLESVPLDNVKFSRAELPDAPKDAAVGQGDRQSNPRLESITDLVFYADRVLIAGLSNEEFSSSLRSVPFPFKTVGNGTSVEMYHGSHGRFETRAPVRTFVPFMIGKEPYLLAAYTCTPLVEFPLSELKPGAKITGKTIAELGNRNRPLDMIVYQRDGKNYLLLTNSSRGVMKISTDAINTVEGIVAPVPDGGTKGLTYESLDTWKGVDHISSLDNQNVVLLRHLANGSQNLECWPLP